MSDGDDYAPSDPGLQWVRHRDGTGETLVVVPEDPHDEWSFTHEDVAGCEVHPTYVVGESDSVCAFSIRQDRSDAFEAFTDAHVQRQLAIIIDGELEVAPVIMSPLRGEGVISGGGGGFTLEEAEALATVLRTRPLPATVELVSER